MSILRTPRASPLDILSGSKDSVANMCKANSWKTWDSVNVATEKKSCKQGDNMLDPKDINTPHVEIVDQEHQKMSSNTFQGRSPARRPRIETDGPREVGDMGFVGAVEMGDGHWVGSLSTSTQSSCDSERCMDYQYSLYDPQPCAYGSYGEMTNTSFLGGQGSYSFDGVHVPAYCVQYPTEHIMPFAESGIPSSDHYPNASSYSGPPVSTPDLGSVPQYYDGYYTPCVIPEDYSDFCITDDSYCKCIRPDCHKPAMTDSEICYDHYAEDLYIEVSQSRRGPLPNVTCDQEVDSHYERPGLREFVTVSQHLKCHKISPTISINVICSIKVKRHHHYKDKDAFLTLRSAMCLLMDQHCKRC